MNVISTGCTREVWRCREAAGSREKLRDIVRSRRQNVTDSCKILQAHAESRKKSESKEVGVARLSCEIGRRQLHVES